MDLSTTQPGTTPTGQPTLAALYSQHSTDRLPFLERARDSSKLSLPYLVPPQGSTASSKLKVTYSSFGARCVNSLAAKLTLTLFPANAPFFKYQIAKDELAKISANPAQQADVDKALQGMESTVTDTIETSATRPPASMAVKHLIVAGNVLAYLKPDNGLKVFGLSSFVVKRDPVGNVLLIVVEEDISPMELPDAVRQSIMASEAHDKDKQSNENHYKLYTGVFRRTDGWEVYQEVCGHRIAGTAGKYPVDACPWMPLRWTTVDGEDYGRSHVEEYLGDLISLEGLTAAIVKGSAAAAKVVFLTNPNGVTKKAALSRAETGDVIDGKKDDVTVMQMEKYADFKIAQDQIAELKEELSFAFLLNTAIQRQAERVTAEEIKYMASELDSTLGGIYSTLSLEFQLPFIRRLTVQMTKQGKLPVLPKGLVTPTIITGIDALGRGAELDKLRAFTKDLVDLGGPAALQTYMNFSDYLTRLATARGLNTDGLIKTPQEVAAAMQQAQQQATVQSLGPHAIQAAGGVMKQSMANQAGAQ